MLNTIKQSCIGKTDIGYTRSNNEDHYAVICIHQDKSICCLETSLISLHEPEHCHDDVIGYVMILADGMGGAGDGEIASSTAVKSLIHSLPDMISPMISDHESSWESIWMDYVKHTQREIAEQSLKVNNTHMGTTLSVVAVIWPNIYILNVGDSRVYLLKNNRLVQLTRDQTLAQRMIDLKILPEEVANRPPLSNTLWGYLGCDPNTLSPQFLNGMLSQEDKVLVCSDGLSSYVDASIIENTLKGNKNTDSICEHLIQKALVKGGKDNITLCLFQHENGTRQESIHQSVDQSTVSTIIY